MIFLLIISSLIIGVILVEVLRRLCAQLKLSNRLTEIATMLQFFRQTVGDDDARQNLILCAGFTTLKLSLTGLGLLFCIAVIVWLPPWVLDLTMSQQVAYLVSLSLMTTLWWLIRRLDMPLTVRNSPYSALERWLHWLALEPAPIRHLAFDLERQFALPKRPKSEALISNQALNTFDSAQGAVYVCGLARSGTTILLQILDHISIFRSLRYRDMPFVLAPNLWNRITRHTSLQPAPVERAHGDGIKVDFDSAEAFEEVFWRTYGKQTLTQDSFSAEMPSSDVLDAFADYRALVAASRTQALPANGIARRYLSKNNNNLLRLRSLCADPTATMLLVYRDPVATARSLHRQHLHFCAAQTKDRFIRTYMGWLGHYEFGLDHRPFGFAKPEMNASLSPNDPNYWLDYWNAVYLHVLAQQDLRLYLVSHAVLCSQPLGALKALFDVLDVQADAAMLAKHIDRLASEAVDTAGFCPELLRRSNITYCELTASPKNLFTHEEAKR